MSILVYFLESTLQLVPHVINCEIHPRSIIERG
jgi:hypothetical protein